MKANQSQLFWTKQIKKGAALNPVDRTSEVLFGLIMVLSFTGTISITNHNSNETKELLWAALGCNLAWGLIDAVMYLMNIAIERGHALKLLKTIQNSTKIDYAAEALLESLPPLMSTIITATEVEQLCERVKVLPAPSKKNVLNTSDFIAALQIFFLVFLCTFPVAVPFAIITDVAVAIRISNLLALVLLFIGGYILSKYAGFRPLVTAIIYCLIGLLLVALTMLLGG